MQGRFDMLRPSFYLDNLLNEPHRYFLGVRDPATYLRVGFWLVVVGLPASLIWLAWRWRRGGDARAPGCWCRPWHCPACWRCWKAKSAFTI